VSGKLSSINEDNERKLPCSRTVTLSESGSGRDGHSSYDKKEMQNLTHRDGGEDDWKANVEARISDLVSEIQGMHTARISQFVTKGQLSIVTEKSFATMSSDGCGGCINLLDLVKNRRVAGVQCIWLLLCLSIFIYLGVEQYKRARANTFASWKPLSMNNVIDYGIPGEDQYHTPVFLLRALVTPDDYKDDDEAIALLELMFGSQGEATIAETKQLDVFCMYESESINFSPEMWNIQGYFGENNLWFGMNHLTYNISREVPLLGDNENSFVAGLYIEIDDPNPAKGPWMCGLYMELMFVTFGQMIDISYVQLSASRSKQDVAFDPLGKFCKIEFDGKDYFHFTYSEKFINRYDGTIDSSFVEHFETNVDSLFLEFDQLLGGLGRAIFQIVPDLQIETWEEFIEYDYIDWILAMGGMVSWISILFFWGAYYLHTFLDKTGRTMGILPMMSFVFMNAEEVQWVKYQLKTLGILKTTSREKET